MPASACALRGHQAEPPAGLHLPSVSRNARRRPPAMPAPPMTRRDAGICAQTAPVPHMNHGWLHNEYRHLQPNTAQIQLSSQSP